MKCIPDVQQAVIAGLTPWLGLQEKWIHVTAKPFLSETSPVWPPAGDGLAIAYDANSAS